MKAAPWLRVSTDEQNAANQEPALVQLATSSTLEIVATFNVSESAYKRDHRVQL